MTVLGLRLVPTRWSPAAGGLLATLVGWVGVSAAIFVGLAIPLHADGKGVVLVVGLVLALAVVGAALERYCVACARPGPRADAWCGIAGFVLGAVVALWSVFGRVGPIPMVWMLPGLGTWLALRLRPATAPAGRVFG